MGLDTTHGCWHGAYSAFMRWRRELCKVAGLPPLDLMEGFYESSYVFHDCRTDGLLGEVRQILPIKWDCLNPSPLHVLLNHSDCDGSIASEDCGPLADALEKLIPLLPKGEEPGHIGDWRDKTQAFVDGLRAAAEAGEDVEFH